MIKIQEFIKSKRLELNLTQKDLAMRAGVGLRFVRDLEQGKQAMKTDTINKVLRLFGKTIGPVNM